MKNQILKSYAKINLFLNVAKKSKNESLHNIQSLVFLINIIDKIFIRKSKEKRDKIKISGKFRKHVNKFDNSIINSLRVLRRERKRFESR